MNRWSTLLIAAAIVAPTAVEGQKPSSNLHTRSADAYLAVADREGVIADKQVAMRKALEAAMSGISASPDNSKSWFQAGRAYLGLADYVGADSAFTRAEQLYPEYAEEITPIRLNAWVEAYNAGVVALQANNVQEATAALERAQLMYRKRPEAMVTLGSIYVQAGDLPKGEATFRQALDLIRGPERASLDAAEAEAWSEEEVSVSMRLANIYVTQAKLGQATEVYRELLKTQPENGQARASLARVLVQDGKADEAMAVYRELLEMEDLPETTLANIGIGLYSAQDFDGATTAFQRLLALNPVSNEALYNLAQSLFGQSAALDGERASAPDARKQEIAAELARLNQELLATAEKLVALDPTNRNGLMMLAQAQRSLGELAPTAEQKKWQDATLATLERHKAIAFEVSDINVVPSGTTAQVMGRVTNLTVAAGSPIEFRFSVIDQNGVELSGHDVSVAAPAAGESVRFNATLTAAENAAGWKYTVKP